MIVHRLSCGVTEIGARHLKSSNSLIGLPKNVSILSLLLLSQLKLKITRYICFMLKHNLPMTIFKFLRALFSIYRSLKMNTKQKKIIINIFTLLFDRVPRKGLTRPCDKVIIIQGHCHFPGVL